MELAQRILSWRAWKGWTQKQLADAVGVSVPAVSLWESGATSPTQANLLAIVKALGLTMGRFYGAVPKKRRAGAAA